MATTIKFGTDGWRAVIAEDYTFANVRIVTQAVADFLHDERLAGRGLVVGYDTRFGSERFAIATAEVLAANGIHVYLTEKATPTPVICWSVLAKKAGGASIITASHNPPTDNGYKYKPEYAGSASPEVVAKLEERLDRTPVKTMPLREAERQGLVERFNGTPDYVAQIKQMVDLEAIKRAGWTIMSDAMYGAGAGYLPMLLDG
ncbi:MAG TPA: phosphoglucomutase/phosphomannomutase family protein, partial [Herpetosiphonaceae bacterium]|nr:phosphoglucomutase/phosphomannomutase family protein [Herpetosiphonaceae bacterium]